MVVCTAHAQRTMKPKLPGNDYQKFLKTQWWLGLNAGINYTGVKASQTISSINPIDYDISELAKSYSNYSEPGLNIGLVISFYHHGFSLETQPGFKQHVYGFASGMNWEGNTPEQQFRTRLRSQQKLNYIDLPIVFKYELIHTGRSRPFVGIGATYAFLIGAEKNTTITHTEFTSGEGRSYPGGKIIVHNEGQFDNFAAVKAGGGATFDLLNIRAVLEIYYNHGLSNISNEGSRFQINELTTIGEVNDDLNLNHLSASLSLVFPLRYIDKTFQAY